MAQAIVSEYEQGAESARREIKADGLTSFTAQRYLDECAKISPEMARGRDAFDRGFMDAFRAFAALRIASCPRQPEASNQVSL